MHVRNAERPCGLELTPYPAPGTLHSLPLIRSCGYVVNRPADSNVRDPVTKPSHERKTQRRRPMHGGGMNPSLAISTRRGAFTSHQFKARILRHPHVVGAVVVCSTCGTTAPHCAASGGVETVHRQGD
jgi:hypothetical protein